VRGPMTPITRPLMAWTVSARAWNAHWRLYSALSMHGPLKPNGYGDQGYPLSQNVIKIDLKLFRRPRPYSR